MKMIEYLLLQPLKKMWEVEEVVEDDDENPQNANVVDVDFLNDSFVFDYEHDDGIQLLILLYLFQQYDQVQVEFHVKFHCQLMKSFAYGFVVYMIEQELYE
jgi:hypothetical protein